MRPLPKTKAAIEAYDLFYEEFATGIYTLKPEEVQKAFDELERLAKAVGIAYGEETSDINNIATCGQCIRPGLKNPPPGFEVSFVRRMVKDWEKIQ